MEGLIYPNWQYADTLPDKYSFYYAGFDYGSSHASALILLGYADGKLYAYKEYKQAGLSNTQILNGIVSTLGETKLPIYADPSAAGFIRDMKRIGLNVRRANNDVLPGIQTTQTLLESGKLLISRDCPELIKELHGYTWATNDSADKPVKANDDAVDALRYAVMSTMTKPVAVSRFTRR